MLVAMAAMFVAALAVPDAFGRHGVIFGVAFLIVRVMHVALYALAGRGDRDLLQAVLRITPSTVVGAALIIAAGFVSDDLKPALWLGALAVDYLGPLVSGTRGWRVHPAHFTERHELIVIIALGESLIAIGLGAAGAEIDTGVIVTAVLGLAVATSFWLAYFDFFSIRGAQMLADRSGAERAALARDAYSYLHLPMVVGIVLFALAMKKTLAHVGGDLDTIAAFALCGGSALYLSAFVALRIRTQRRLSRGRFVALVGFLVAFPVATFVPALAALVLVTAVWTALHAYELIWWREARAQTRALRTAAG
jgi:low temperature requirement protein LtrA